MYTLTRLIFRCICEVNKACAVITLFPDKEIEEVKRPKIMLYVSVRVHSGVYDD